MDDKAVASKPKTNTKAAIQRQCYSSLEEDFWIVADRFLYKNSHGRRAAIGKKLELTFGRTLNLTSSVLQTQFRTYYSPEWSRFIETKNLRSAWLESDPRIIFMLQWIKSKQCIWSATQQSDTQDDARQHKQTATKFDNEWNDAINEARALGGTRRFCTACRSVVYLWENEGCCYKCCPPEGCGPKHYMRGKMFLSEEEELQKLKQLDSALADAARRNVNQVDEENEATEYKQNPKTQDSNITPQRPAKKRRITKRNISQDRGIGQGSSIHLSSSSRPQAFSQHLQAPVPRQEAFLSRPQTSTGARIGVIDLTHSDEEVEDIEDDEDDPGQSLKRYRSLMKQKVEELFAEYRREPESALYIKLQEEPTPGVPKKQENLRRNFGTGRFHCLLCGRCLNYRADYLLVIHSGEKRNCQDCGKTVPGTFLCGSREIEKQSRWREFGQVDDSREYGPRYVLFMVMGNLESLDEYGPKA